MAVSLIFVCRRNIVKTVLLLDAKTKPSHDHRHDGIGLASTAGDSMY